MHVFAKWSLTWNNFHSLLTGSWYLHQCQKNAIFLRGAVCPLSVLTLSFDIAVSMMNWQMHWPGLDSREIRRLLAASDMDLKAYCPEVKSPNGIHCHGCEFQQRGTSCNTWPWLKLHTCSENDSYDALGENILDLVSENLSLNDSSVRYELLNQGKSSKFQVSFLTYTVKNFNTCLKYLMMERDDGWGCQMVKQCADQVSLIPSVWYWRCLLYCYVAFTSNNTDIIIFKHGFLSWIPLNCHQNWGLLHIVVREYTVFSPNTWWKLQVTRGFPLPLHGILLWESRPFRLRHYLKTYPVAGEHWFSSFVNPFHVVLFLRFSY